MDPRISALLDNAFGHPSPSVLANTDAGQDRGVFSHVRRLELQWPAVATGRPQYPATATNRPQYVVAKLPADGPNGSAAAGSGAYRREAEAYRRILPHSPVAAPQALAVIDDADDRFTFLLEDLTGMRRIDQLDGLDAGDAHVLADALGRFHRYWATRLTEIKLPSIGRNVASQLDQTALDAGLDRVRAGFNDSAWSEDFDDDVVAAFGRVVDAMKSVDGKIGHQHHSTLCHGDPRADNIVFAPDGGPIIFDWQQIVIQPGEFDLSWLAATSLETSTRRDCERAMVENYGGSFETYRAGFARPAVLVLLLAQRQLPSPRLQKMAATSVRRIGQALVDLEVADLLGRARPGP